MDNIRDSRREDICKLPRKLDARVVDHRRHEAEIRRYFENRLARLQVACTTRTPYGQVIDWIPRESQLKRGQTLAEPPPGTHDAPAVNKERPDRLVRFELEDPKVERGPEGTVPVLRKNLDGIRFSQPLRKLLAKYPYANYEAPMAGRMQPQPSVDGPHWHAMTDQSVICFGGEGVLSAFDPYCENTDDDDNVGGYNQDVDGWVQYDGSVHPGAISSPNSTRGGDQYVMQIKYQLYQGNWWFRCNGRWLGYYPASLFMGRQSVFSTLGDHADHINFYGEIYDSNET